MQRAEYAPRKVGHFALASKHYCHFTSPIRRYPDLTVHRLLDLHIRGQLDKAKSGDAVPTFEALEKLGRLCSNTEHRATSAERELRKIKILQLLEHRLGSEVIGIVTGVANAGVFVQIEKYLIDGLVRLKDLPDDWWDIDNRAGSLVGQRTGIRITIGDVVRVRLEAINHAARELDLVLVEDEKRPARPLATAKKPKVKKSGRNKKGAKVRATDPSPKRKRGGSQPKRKKGIQGKKGARKKPRASGKG